METLIAYLEKLKSALPVTCTLFNLQRLKLQWSDFKNFVSSLPEQLADIKNKFLERLEQVKMKIDAVENNFGSWKEARYAFQEATVCLKAEMDILIATMQA